MGLERVTAINFTPRSIVKGLKYYWEWLTLGEDEQIRRSTEGRKELRLYLKRTYGKVGFILELHDDPAPSRTHGYVSFPAWNLKLKEVIEKFSKRLRKFGYIMSPSSSAPAGRVGYHSAVLEYFPKGAERADLRKEDGLFILRKLLDLLKYEYLSN